MSRPGLKPESPKVGPGPGFPGIRRRFELRSDAAYTVLLVRTIEEVDAEGSVLSRARRLEATHQAAASTGLSPAATRRTFTPEEERFLVCRATLLWNQIQAACPRFLHPDAHPGIKGAWWMAGLLAAAFVLGALLNELGSGHRLNLLSFPLLGMLIWNVVVYLLLVVGWIRSRFPSDSEPHGSRIAQRLSALRLHQWERQLGSALKPVENEILKQGLVRFASRWLRWTRPLWTAWTLRGLHLAAAAFAAGLVAALYWRGLSVEYVVGWESTFLGPEFTHRLIRIVLSPAAALLGMELPGIEAIRAMRWSEGQTPPNAGPYIHLFAMTAMGFILIPRLLLAGAQFWRENSLQRHFPLPEAEAACLRRLCVPHPEGKERLRVVPHNLDLGEPDREALTSLFGDWLGAVPQVDFADTLVYGDEEVFLRREDLKPRDFDHLIGLFNLAATPEAEVQGHLVRGLASRIKNSESLSVLLDESHFRERFSHQENFEERLDRRIQAWTGVVGLAGVRVIHCDLRRPGLASAQNPFMAAPPRSPEDPGS